MSKGKFRYYVNYGKDMGSNPANINLDSGKISVNPEIWENLTPEERAIILTHEIGHLENNSANEVLADKYLIEKLGTSKENLIKIIKTIDLFAPDTPKNRLRKIELVRNVLKQNKQVEDSNRTANWITAAIGAAATIFGAIAPTLFSGRNKSQWQKLGGTEKSVIVKDAITSAIYLVYNRNNGNWDKVIAVANLPYADPNSILSVAYVVLQQAGLFEGSKSNTDSSPISFWASYFSPTGLTPQYWVSQIENYKEKVVLTYKQQNPIKSTLFSNKIISFIVIIAIGMGVYFIIKKFIK